MENIPRKTKYLDMSGTILKYFGILTVSLILIFGCLILFTDYFVQLVNSPFKKYSLGILFISYGLFRVYRLIRSFKSQD